MPFVDSAVREPVDSTVDQVFWRNEARRIHWRQPFRQVMAPADDGPGCRWFAGGTTNLCYNAVDRHLPRRAGRTALVWCDPEGNEQLFSYADLHREVQGMAWILRQCGVRAGDRVVICLPIIPPALFAMLACARLGAVHVTVYAQLSASALSERLALSQPRVLITDEGIRTRLRDALPALSPSAVLLTVGDTGTEDLPGQVRYEQYRQQYTGQPVPCRWLPSEAPSQLLFTSGTTGAPKGVLRDTGGYAVALCASLPHIFHTGEQEVFFTTADIGWVTGHSYLVWAPLLAGFTTLLVTGGGINHPGKRWWQLIERHRVTRLLTVPGAMRLARRQHSGPFPSLPSLRAVYLAGEPLDGQIRQWLEHGAGKPVYDHYWQTESGWPILAGRHGELRPVLDREVAVINEHSLQPAAAGMLVLRQTLGPGGMQTLWGHDEEFVARYWRHDGNEWLYLTHDQAYCDANGALCIQGRMDDTMNIGGKRLATAEVEHAALAVDGVAEAAAVGIHHPLLGQMVQLYAVPTGSPSAQQQAAIKRALAAEIVARCGRHARPRRIIMLDHLPKTFSGKVIRRFLRASG